MQETEKQISFENTGIAFSYKNNSELKKAAWLYSLINYPLLTKIGTTLTPWAFRMGLPIKGLVRQTIFSQFCGGETLDECAATTEKLSNHRVETILDYGVEAKETDEEFEKTVREISRAVEFAGKNHHVPFASIKITGICAFGLLEKIHAKQPLNGAEEKSWQKVKDRLFRLCTKAQQTGTGLMIDAEETWIQDPIDELANDMMKQFNRGKVTVMNTFQLYRIDKLNYLERSLALAKSGHYILGAKLVRGAYMEKERKHAAEKGMPCLIQTSREASDRDYNMAVVFCINNIDGISFCVASHNEHSNLLGAGLTMKKGLPPSHPHLHFSQLYGMSDNITFNLAHAGYNVTKYVPFGPVEEVIPYLMRRAQENTSVGGMSSRELILIRKELKRRKSKSEN